MTAKSDSPTLERIFTAIMMPDGLSRQLLELPQKGVQGRWNNWRDLHITLRFIGDIDPARIPEMKDDLKRVKRPPVDIEIDGLDIFYTPRQPVLFADVKSKRKLETLVADITDILQPYDIYIPERPYRPHVTLARLKKTPKKTAETYIRQHSGKVKGHFKADSFHLIHSGTPDAHGAVYTSLAEYPLVD
mgnify:FL=1